MGPAQFGGNQDTKQIYKLEGFTLHSALFGLVIE